METIISPMTAGCLILVQTQPNTRAANTIVAICANSTEAVKASRKLQPDILLLDINMGPFDGIEAAQRIRRVSPETGIIAVTMSTHPAHAKKMLRIGAKGYMTKNSSISEMIDAILAVSEGEIFICAEMTELLSKIPEGDGKFTSAESLTAREIQIVDLIKAGHSSKEISQALDISVKTVQTHRYNLFRKLGVRSAVSLVNVLNNGGWLN